MRYFLVLFLVVILCSCSGILYEGTPRAVSDTVNITVRIEDPMWDAYLEHLRLTGEL